MSEKGLRGLAHLESMTPQRKEHLQGGAGGGFARYLVPPKGQRPGSRFRMIGRIALDPGAEVGSHPHEEDEELYVILSGEGLYEEDGLSERVGPGDMMLVERGHRHGIRNIGDAPLEFLAAIAE
jgi:mannose-6-phosphate isomerase-like protein (cupin superfamily)